MKAAVLPVLLLLGGAFALPSQNAENRDVVIDSIMDIIKRIAQLIKDLGLDPLERERLAFEYEGNYLQLKAFVEDLSFTGLSNVVIANLQNNVLFGTLDFDLVFPEVSVTVGNSGLSVGVWENNVESELKGSLSIRNFRIAGQVRYSGSIIIGGVEIVSIAFQNRIGVIHADLTIVRNGKDISEPVNRMLNDTIPNTLTNFSEEINALLAEFVMAIIRRLTF